MLIDYAAMPSADAGRLVKAPAELTSLRSLRASAVAQRAWIGLRVQLSPSGETFTVLPWDEAPANVAEALRLVD